VLGITDHFTRRQTPLAVYSIILGSVGLLATALFDRALPGHGIGGMGETPLPLPLWLIMVGVGCWYGRETNLIPREQPESRYAWPDHHAALATEITPAPPDHIFRRHHMVGAWRGEQLRHRGCEWHRGCAGGNRSVAQHLNQW
jgi:hypothetical protein